MFICITKKTHLIDDSTITQEILEDCVEILMTLKIFTVGHRTRRKGCSPGFPLPLVSLVVKPVHGEFKGGLTPDTLNAHA